jgi:phosphopantothenoylcysteine decarboxylase/phosphopantothenate--cysteine ligase
MLKGKKILLGVTGGIAAYKSAELTRGLIKRGAEVKVIMTKNAAEFITPLTLQTLSGNPVYMDMFSLLEWSEIGHISLAEYPDLILIAPATANVIGKVASGLADDLLTTTIMASKAPVLFCPAMNANMYENRIVQDNMKKLTSLGYLFMQPDTGQLACKIEGQGRLPDPDQILEMAEYVLTEKDLAEETILITAGPTREPFDPVRFISNYSSGKMGYALARAAHMRGANVTLISGPTSLEPPCGVNLIHVSSAIEMRKAVLDYLESAGIVIKAAAVADYRPASKAESKIKKRDGNLQIELERNPDIIAEIGKNKGDRILIGFAMETDDLISNAKKKLMEKNMDLIVANDLNTAGAGFQGDTNCVKLIGRDGAIEDVPLMEKIEVANRILNRIKMIRSERIS